MKVVSSYMRSGSSRRRQATRLPKRIRTRSRRRFGFAAPFVDDLGDLDLARGSSIAASACRRRCRARYRDPELAISSNTLVVGGIHQAVGPGLRSGCIPATNTPSD